MDPSFINLQVEQLRKEKLDSQSEVSFDAHFILRILFQINTIVCSFIVTIIHINLTICLLF